MPINLLTTPHWKAEHLGLPMPDSQHAVSVALPLWEHNVKYEEGDPEVIGRLQAAYPRFCLHPFVRRLCLDVFGAENSGLIFPSVSAAERAIEYVVWRGGKSARRVQLPGQSACGVAIDPDEFSRLREYWQHAGEVLTSRAAELILHGRPVSSSETLARQTVRQRVREFRKDANVEVWLYPCGMAAIAAVWRAVRQRESSLPSVQFGFPYVDTLKIQQRFAPANARFYPVGDKDELQQLVEFLNTNKIAAVFCESTTNPLLKSLDLARLRQLADQHGFLLVIDDTLAACVNHDVLPYADVVVTSLTKYFGGYGDVLAGSVTLNPSSHHAEWLRSGLGENFEELLCDVDIEVLEHNSRNVWERVEVINHNAHRLAEWLTRQPQIECVYHPSLDGERFEWMNQHSAAHNGGLLSIVLKNPAETTPIVFNHLEVCKGPNLGTNFTLCCPYTILAHYTELDYVEQCGVSRWLLRISVGTEPYAELQARFARALSYANV
ncbi:MAG TPA: aminotransferase class I/II-fold pyridoxal phosphate-dependent enzyme [Planctomycetaceae bacterium]|nr:aminotransferase class I/II-fold pyridoxal phosphate-dependent enzyme [Planctomycetaceae bacterium]HQZ65435.1 aminotransferase class I/II-fold pyridoxal phosphate-dependent enzyme [Planctomycetaceae bacterium]